MTRVEQLRERIERGEYDPAPAAVAGALVERWRRLGVIETRPVKRREPESALAPAA